MAARNRADLSRLRELEAEATPGPWEQWAGYGWPPDDWWPLREAGKTQDDAPTALAKTTKDQELICALRNAAPSMLDALEAADALAEAIEQTKARIDPFMKTGVMESWRETNNALAAYQQARSGGDAAE